jgi:RNA polymerase sigma factor (sigma-70 family)
MGREGVPISGVWNASSLVPYPMSFAEQTRWFSEHVHPHEPALRAYLSKRFPSLRDHDDLVQETYARLLRIEDPRRLEYPKAFLFTTARNAAIDLFRRSHAHPQESIAEMDDVAELPLLEAPPTAFETLERRQRRETLTEALRALPERCREVMLLRYLDGCSGKEIAARLDISLGTVKGHLLKGVRDCARFFEERGLVEAAPGDTRNAS